MNAFGKNNPIVTNEKDEKEISEAEKFFTKEIEQVIEHISNYQQIVSKATKHYPKKKKDKESLRKAFSELQKLHGAQEELYHQKELLFILQQLHVSHSEALEKYDMKAYFGFGVKFAQKIQWIEWSKPEVLMNELDKAAIFPVNDCSNGNCNEDTKEEDLKTEEQIQETCSNIKDKWNFNNEEVALSKMNACGKNNLPRRTLMSLLPPSTPCKEIVYAYFKVIEETLNGSIKIANHFWSTEKYFQEKNGFPTAFNNSEKLEKLFVIISPNPYGVEHFVLYILEPTKKSHYLYDPLGLMDSESVRDNAAINQAIENAKSHAHSVYDDIYKWKDDEKKFYQPKTTCIGLTGFYITQFAKQICKENSKISIGNTKIIRNIMLAELLEGHLL
uniref:Ubiquitin-like protease family profile domain-containing protein n=1 Tax=Panagrolaimus sp. ES5 TaxID=591445 RepID=A0AC34G6P1_9BILA